MEPRSSPEAFRLTCEHDRVPANLPRLELLRCPSGASDLVILAHGGSERADQPASDWHRGLMRVVRFGEVSGQAAPGAAVALLRYRFSGWNGARADPAQDLHQVIETAPAHFRRVVLVGHSMGGRAVLRTSPDPRVAGVLALAPWVPPDEPVLRPSQGPVILATGTDDRTTTTEAARRFVSRSRNAGCHLGYFEVEGAGHYLLRHSRAADHLIRCFLAHALGDGDDFIGSAISADKDRRPDRAPATVGATSYVSGPVENLASVLRWRSRVTTRIH